jgi:hypothetical protein
MRLGLANAFFFRLVHAVDPREGPEGRLFYAALVLALIAHSLCGVKRFAEDLADRLVSLD